MPLDGICWGCLSPAGGGLGGGAGLGEPGYNGGWALGPGLGRTTACPFVCGGPFVCGVKLAAWVARSGRGRGEREGRKPAPMVEG